MKIKINNNKASFLFFNGESYETNKEIEVDFAIALRLSRISDVSFFAESAPYNPALFKDDKRFVFVSEIDTVSGWGNVSLNLIKYSMPPYNISQIGKLLNVQDHKVLESSKNPIDAGMAAIFHEQPKSSWLTSPFQKKIAIVPFETTIIPSSWIGRINACSALFVPCKQNMDAFRESGVTIPIELIHWGIDPEKFYELERPERDVFTFGTMGALSKRKGTDILLAAFQQAFPVEKDVRLICKTSYHGFMGAVKDPRIQIDMTPVPHDELMQNFFKPVDCFVFPTRGEGFGLTPLEAMATGIPAIVTGWSGPVEYMNNEVGWLINYNIDPAKEFTDNVYREDCGKWATPSLDHLVHLMRHAYNNRAEVRAKGKAAAEHVRKNWLWEQKIKMFHEQLEKYL